MLHVLVTPANDAILYTAQFALSNVKRAIPLFKSKGKELIEHFNSRIKAHDGVTDGE